MLIFSRPHSSLPSNIVRFFREGYNFHLLYQLLPVHFHPSSPPPLTLAKMVLQFPGKMLGTVFALSMFVFSKQNKLVSQNNRQISKLAGFSTKKKNQEPGLEKMVNKLVFVPFTIAVKSEAHLPSPLRLLHFWLS